ncbi:MAG: YkvA family protein [Candidatus Zixiibacteriota bacterium]
MLDEDKYSKNQQFDPEMEDKVKNYITDESSSQKAESVLDNDKKLDYTLSKAEKRYKKLGEGPIDRVIEESKALWRLIKAYKNKKYDNVPKSTIIASVIALLYLINPFDVIPDMLPLLGQIDDALVISTILYAISNDLHKFLIWEKKKEKSGEDFASQDQ